MFFFVFINELMFILRVNYFGRDREFITFVIIIRHNKVTKKKKKLIIIIKVILTNLTGHDGGRINQLYILDSNEKSANDKY